jgi:putative (di)nucleoside polyphosphate hydrolase
MTAPPAPRADARGPHPGFRANVGLLIVDRQGDVFLGERRGPTTRAWQMPQGGIEPGEPPSAAAWRELVEEVGTDRAVLLAESRFWYAYHVPAALIPAHWPAGVGGQSQKWFAFRFTGHDADIDIHGDHPEFVAWRWAAPDEVLRVATSFKKEVYRAVLAEFRAFLTPMER